MLVEPHEANCRSMRQLYESRGVMERCTIIQAAIVRPEYQGDTVTIYDKQDPHGPNGPSRKSSIRSDWWYESELSNLYQTDVPCLTSKNLIKQIGMEIDFVTIDAEGLSFEIARRMPWAKMPTRLLSVESPRDCISMIESQGWRCCEIFQNDLFFTR